MEPSIYVKFEKNKIPTYKAATVITRYSSDMAIIAYEAVNL